MSSNEQFAWSIFAPLAGAALAAILLIAHNWKAIPRGFALWLRLIGLLASLAGLAVEVALVAVLSGSATFDPPGISLGITTPARFVLIAANVALFCAVLYAWTAEDDPQNPGPEWTLILAPVTSSLLAGAALSTDRIIAVLFLAGAALSVSAMALARPRTPLPFNRDLDEDNIAAQTMLARRVAGGLKHIGLSILGTGLLAVGSVLVARYAFNLENRGLLQLGLALLAVGLIVRAGGMPFAAAAADTIQASPPTALAMLGASTPVALVVGLLLFTPVEGSLAQGASAGWLGAIGTFLAGLRSLGSLLESRQHTTNGVDNSRGHGLTTPEANLLAMTVAAATGWAIFGVLSGSRMGAVGAILIALNIALSLPIALGHRRWRPAGIASLLGLPPLGGFAGMILVAQSAANEGGLWLAILLLGSAMVAAGWLALTAGSASTDDLRGWRGRLLSPLYFVPILLIVLQIAIFLWASQLTTQLNLWALVPWLTAP
ncbi:MAG: hypothetical protein ABI670_13240 [Chloroflexota bacterium]